MSENVIWGPDETHRHSPEQLREMGEIGHYMESTSRLRAENEKLRQALGECAAAKTTALDRVEAVRSWAIENRDRGEFPDFEGGYGSAATDVAELLDIPPVVEPRDR